MRIILKDDIPVYQPARRLSFSENQDVNKQIDEWLEQGIRAHAESIVIIYMDDLVIPAKDEKEGLEKLREVLEVASKYGLEMKFKKCQFLRRKVEFFGPRRRKWDNTSFNCKNNSRQEVSGTNNSQTSAELLGLTGYFRKFIPAYSQMRKPLSDLTRKDNPFMFEQPQMEAFEKA
ncbi:transposon Tf2-6 polyprotein [Trichonephila clavipes]|nr:transposon Tf2-6 polyprotein [Trichonephila clavipes]